MRGSCGKDPLELVRRATVDENPGSLPADIEYVLHDEGVELFKVIEDDN